MSIDGSTSAQVGGVVRGEWKVERQRAGAARGGVSSFADKP